MPIKKSDDIENEGSDFANQKDTAKLANINERFDETSHNDNPYDDAIQYLSKKVDEVVDETNVQTVASASLSIRVSTNEAKRSPTGKEHDFVMSVDRASRALVISSGEGDGIITWTIAADER